MQCKSELQKLVAKPSQFLPTCLVILSLSIAPTQAPVRVFASESSSLRTVTTTAQISNVLFYDANANGIQDSGELGIPGVEMALWLIPIDGTAAQLLQTTVTNASGAYSFVDYGGNLFVQVTASNFRAGGRLEFHQAANRAGMAMNTRLARTATPSSTDVSDISFPSGVGPMGFYRMDVGGTIWHDANRNGRHDADELPASDAEVTLYDSNNVRVSKTRTDAAGTYQFTRILSGSYSIQVVLSASDAALNMEASPLANISPDDNVDDDSNALPGSVGYGATPYFHAVPGDVGARSSNQVRAIDGATINNTIDMGFVLYMPTSLALRNFDASVKGKTVDLQWMVGNTMGVAGFHVYRVPGYVATQGYIPQNAVRVTPRKVEAFGDGIYNVKDTTAVSHTEYSYYLEEYDMAGRTVVQGPVPALTGVGSSPTFLPMVTSRY